MYKSILVPIALDHTGRSEPAIATARSLLDPGGTITVLHVADHIPDYVVQQLPPDVFDRNAKETEGKLSLIAKEIGSNSRAVVLRGHAASSILEHAKANDIDCIVIASHKPGFQDYLLGSTASRVVRHAQCAVHVIR